jgi:hypothetical protein
MFAGWRSASLAGLYTRLLPINHGLLLRASGVFGKAAKLLAVLLRQLSYLAH